MSIVLFYISASCFLPMITMIYIKFMFNVYLSNWTISNFIDLIIGLYFANMNPEVEWLFQVSILNINATKLNSEELVEG